MEENATFFLSDNGARRLCKLILRRCIRQFLTETYNVSIFGHRGGSDKDT